MSPSAQAKFLRVLQEREFTRLGGTRVLRADVRVVAATNRDLEAAIAVGQFRDDLYYRLNVFAIRLPGLRERAADIPELSEVFLGEIECRIGRRTAGLSPEALQLLIDYDWPGNVRELRNVLERAAILCDGGPIAPEHLALQPSSLAVPAMMPDASSFDDLLSPPTCTRDLESLERAMIEQALEGARFNKSKAAKALGLTRHQLYGRMRKYGFE
jgi:two-component system response regulator AtoC